MKCKVCGTDQPEGNEYCTYCGAPLRHDEKADVHEERPAPVIREEVSSSQDEKKTTGTWTDVHDETETHHAVGGFGGWMRKMSAKTEALIAWSKNYGGMYLALGIAFIFLLFEPNSGNLWGYRGLSAAKLVSCILSAGLGYIIDRAIIKYCLRKVRGNDEVEDLNIHVAWEFAIWSVISFVFTGLFRGILLPTILSLFVGAVVATTVMSYALMDGEEMKFFWKHITIRLIIYAIIIGLFVLMLASCARGMVNAFPPELLQEFQR